MKILRIPARKTTKVNKIIFKMYHVRGVGKAPARRLSWLQHHPIHQKVTGSIPSQGTYLGCRFDPQWRRIWEATLDVSLLHWCFSPFLSKISKYILEWGLRKKLCLHFNGNLKTHTHTMKTRCVATRQLLNNRILLDTSALNFVCFLPNVIHSKWATYQEKNTGQLVQKWGPKQNNIH